MTSRELEILNIIHQADGGCTMRAISEKTGLSNAYGYLILKNLLKDKLIKQQRNNVFILTPQGGSLARPIKSSTFQEINLEQTSRDKDRDQITETEDAKQIEINVNRLRPLKHSETYGKKDQRTT